MSTGRAARGSLARNALTSYGERGLLLLSTLLLTPILFRALGTSGFGTWSVMVTLTTVFNMIELGVSAGLTKFVAERRAQDDRPGLDALVGVGVALMAAIGLAALAVSAAIALLGTGLAAPAERDAFRTGMLILGVAMFVRYPCVAYGAALTGYQRYDLYNAALATTTLVVGLGSIGVVVAGGGVLALAVVQAAALVAGGALHLVLLSRTDRDLALRPRLGTSAERRNLLGFSGFALLADTAVFVGQRMDAVIVAALRGAAATAPLAAAAKLQSGIVGLTLPVLNMLMPMTSDLAARGESEHVARRFLLATRITTQLTVPVAAAVACFATDVVDVWLGPTAPAVTATIVAVLAVQTMFMAAVPAEKVLVGIGRVRTVGALNLLEGLTNVVLSILLVLRFGAVGAALGSLLASTLLGPLKFPVACRATGVPVRRLAREGLAPALAAAVPALLVMGAVRVGLEPGGGRLLLGVGGGLAVAAAAAVVQFGPGRLAALVRGRLAARSGGGGARLVPAPATPAADAA
jgi:O-antigen/teichoic acid export membrane protein